jgi:hypothetical protein
MTNSLSVSRYRAAIWLGRFNIILVALLFWLALGQTRQSSPWFFPLWLLLLVSTLTGLALLRRSGVPFVRRGASWGVVDRRLTWQLYKDFFWYRRP